METLAGQANADVKAQVTGYLLTRNYEEGSFVRRGQILFEIDPRPFQAALDQARGQLAQAQAQLVQDEAQLSTAEANQLKSQLNVEKYEPLAKVDAVSKQEFDNATQTDLANKAQVKAAEAAVAAAKAQIKAGKAAVETAAINLSFTRVISPLCFRIPATCCAPRQYGKVRAIIREQQNAKLIPQAAVKEQQGSYLIAVVDKDNRVSMRPVQVGTAH